MPASGNIANGSDLPELRVSIPLIMLFQVTSLIVGSVVQARIVQRGFDSETARHMGAIAGFAVLAILMWPIMTGAWPAVRNQFRKPRSWLRMIAASVALGFILWLAQMLALLVVAPLEWIAEGPFSHPSWPVYSFGCVNPAALLLAIPVMSAMTPVFEEAINRGMILPVLLRRGRMLGVLASAALFAALHVSASIPFAFVFGVLAALQMMHYRTLWAVIITHGTANLGAVLSQRCIDGYWLPGRMDWNPAMLIMVALIICLAGAWWLATGAEAGVDSVTNHPDHC